LRTLRVEAGCVRSPSFAHLLDLIPTEAPVLSELSLCSSSASAYFLQPHWLPILQNLTVLIVNGRDIREPFDLLPALTQLHIFEADRLLLPWYELDTNMPLLCTLQKLQLRATSVQWMAGRLFPCLEECAILLPRDWEAVLQHEVQLPSCKKLTYHGYPLATVEYFHVPLMRAMDLRSHDCKEERVYQQLRRLCTVDGRISKLSTLHLTLQRSEQAFIKVLKYLGVLQELVLSITYPSPSWKCFLESLAAKPSSTNWPDWRAMDGAAPDWGKWCSSQTWQANVLPHLKYLGIQCPNGCSQSESLDNRALLRLVGWTREQLTPPLEHLKVWEGKRTADDIGVDYISAGYLDKHLGQPWEVYDSMIVRGMITQCLVIDRSLLQLGSTVLFRRLQVLEVKHHHDYEFLILPYLEQIKRLEISRGIIPTNFLNIDLPLIHTLEWLILDHSSFSWMLGRVFKALREFHLYRPMDLRPEGPQVNLPACTTLQLKMFSMGHFPLLSCPNVQFIECQESAWLAIDEAGLKPLRQFLCHCSRLQSLEIGISQFVGLDLLFQLVFCDAQERGAWRDIRSVEVRGSSPNLSMVHGHRPLRSMVRHQQQYEKWWKELTVAREVSRIIVRAST